MPCKGLLRTFGVASLLVAHAVSMQGGDVAVEPDDLASLHDVVGGKADALDACEGASGFVSGDGVSLLENRRCGG